MKRSYLICAPHYDRKSAGIKALYLLCHKLNNLGYDAYITGDPRDCGYNIKSVYSLNKEQLKDLQINGVVVYTDNISGNPLKFTNVVRWFLAYTNKAPEHELVFSFSTAHNINVNTRHNLMMVDIEPYFKFPEIENRTQKCYRVGKGHGGAKIPITNDCIEITYNYPNTRQELANLFKSSSVFYTYDHLSLLPIESLFCGCPVLVIGCTNESKEIISKNFMYKYGLDFYNESCNPDTLNKLKGEIPLQIEIYKEVMIGWEKELSDFINLTENMPNNYVEDLGIHNINNPHPWIAAGFWPDFFKLFRER
jgi:glycosyltransferase involved in cell wall biosynthesis